MVNQEALLKLKESRPWDYAKACEELGDYEEALKYYSEGENRDHTLHAAMIALKIPDYVRVREFIKRAKIIVKKEEDVAKKEKESMNYERALPGGGLQNFERGQEDRDNFRRRINELEGTLIEVGQL